METLFLALALAAQLLFQAPGLPVAQPVQEPVQEPVEDPIDELGGEAVPEQERPPRAARVRQTEGLFVRPLGEKHFVFVPWESEETANQIFRRLEDLGGEVHFAPGRYVLEQGLVIDHVPDLIVSGSPRVVLEFAPAPELEPHTSAPIARGATEIAVDRPDLLVAGWDYQLYAADGQGDRILEFTVAEIEGDVVRLAQPAVYMPHVTEIPAGCQVLVEVNGFEIDASPRLLIQNLTIDGLGRGTIRGHTIYTGVLAVGDYRVGRRPRIFGLTIRGCTFRGLQGRGIAFYGLDEVRIENNYFSDIRAQAIEVDHFASGHVLMNSVHGAQSGVTLNDSFESLVEGNSLAHCDFGVYFMKVFDQRWVNTTNRVLNNTFGPGCVRAVVFRDPGIEGNIVRGNRFIEVPEHERIVQQHERQAARAAGQED